MSAVAQRADDFVGRPGGAGYFSDDAVRVEFFCSLQSQLVERQRDRIASTYGWYLDVGGNAPLSCLRSARVPLQVAFDWLERARNFGFDDAQLLYETADGAAPQAADVWVPPGFEALLEPQLTLADVFFGGRKVGSVMVIYTPDKVEFQAPETIVNALPDLIEPLRVLQSLSGALDPNSAFACGFRGNNACGRLDPIPEVAGVIWDESRFRLDVFVNPEQLAVRGANIGKYLPPSSAEWSMMQTLYAALSGSFEQPDENYSLSGVNTISFRENRLVTDINVANDRFSIDELTVERDFEGLSYRGGYFNGDSSFLSFGTTNSVRGVSIGTSIDTRTDLRQSSGNSIEVFLATRSLVSIYKDGRLISSRNYDSGNQELDTTALPGGSYDIDIRIVDASGRETVETRFYVKSNQLPPLDEPNWYVELGQPTRINRDEVFREVNDGYLAKAGYLTRLSDTTAIGGGVIANNNQKALEIDFFSLNRGLQVDLSGIYADDGGYGFNLVGQLNWSTWTVSANYREIDNSKFDDQGGSITSVDTVLGTSIRQSTLNVTKNTDYGYFSVQARQNERDGQARTEALTFRYSAPVWRFWDSDLSTQFEYTQDDSDWLALLSVNWRFNRGRWNLNLKPEYQANYIDSIDEQLNDGFFEANANWSDQDLFMSDLRVYSSAYKRGNFEGASIEYDHQLRYGRARAQVERRKVNGVNSDNVNLNASTSFIVTDQGVAMGGQQQSQSAVVVNLEGEAAGVWFDVLVDRRPVAYAVPGASTVVTLRPFETYTIELRPRGNGFADLEGDIRTVTLYPGNVVDLDWSVEAATIVFGQVLLPDGTPVANALIEGIKGFASTDDYGLFQLELASSVSALEFVTRDYRCSVDVPEFESSGGVASLGTMVCD